MDTKEKQIRTCIITREQHHKADMIRLVSFRGEPVKIDLSGKASGRGCYISANPSNLDKLLEKNGAILSRIFKRKVSSEELEYLRQELPAAIDKKNFRPRETKPVTVRISKEDLKKIS